MPHKSRAIDPGLALLIVLIVIAALVFIWWPTDIYWMGVSLVGWLMFISLFIWLLLSVIYVYWMESMEDEAVDIGKDDSISS